MQLPVPDVHGADPCSTGLEQTVREAPGRGAYVEAVLAGGIKLEVREGVRKLLAAPRNESRRSVDGKLGCLVYGRARLSEARHAAGEHERLRLGTALGQAAFDEDHVEPLLHGGSLAP